MSPMWVVGIQLLDPSQLLCGFYTGGQLESGAERCPCGMSSVRLSAGSMSPCCFMSPRPSPISATVSTLGGTLLHEVGVCRPSSDSHMSLHVREDEKPKTEDRNILGKFLPPARGIWRCPLGAGAGVQQGLVGLAVVWVVPHPPHVGVGDWAHSSPLCGSFLVGLSWSACPGQLSCVCSQSAACSTISCAMVRMFLSQADLSGFFVLQRDPFLSGRSLKPWTFPVESSSLAQHMSAVQSCTSLPCRPAVPELEGLPCTCCL